MRAFRDLTINVPNPVTTTLSPLRSASVMEPNTAATDSREAFAVRLAFFATTSTKSAFVMEFIHLPSGRRLERAKIFHGLSEQSLRGTVRNLERSVKISFYASHYNNLNQNRK